MKTTRLYIVLGILLPMLALAVAQQDVVGFWRHDFKPGFNLVAFPVLPDNPTVRNVIGDKLGDVEISAFDPQLNRYRAASFDAATGQWSGDLYLLNRGTAYWINIRSEQPRQLTITGHPEQYTRFTWSSLGSGWKFYAPTYGKPENLSALPPENPNDIIIRWNPDNRRFALTGTDGKSAWSITDFDKLEPDQSYLVNLNTTATPRQGPPTLLESSYKQSISVSTDGGPRAVPPSPLLLSNRDGLPICYQSGKVCSGGFTIQVIKEKPTPGLDGTIVVEAVLCDEQVVSPEMSQDGTFRFLLTVGGTSALDVGDRIHLTVIGPKGARTNSDSFTIPDGEFAIRNISFPQPLTSPTEPPVVPERFALGTPFPNPFNSQFRVEFRVPVNSDALLNLYDIGGRLVKSEPMTLSAGIHELTIDGNGLSNGLYFFEISAGSFKQRAKVIYMK